MIILSVIFKLYLIIYMSLIIHELGHYVFRLLFKVRTDYVKIGSGIQIFSCKKIKLHIFPTGGSNQPYTFYNENISKHQKVIIYLGGAMGNLISILFCHDILWISWNVILVIYNLFPFRTKRIISDGLFITAIIYNMKFKK